jgi:glutamate 5-kinase
MPKLILAIKVGTSLVTKDEKINKKFLSGLCEQVEILVSTNEFNIVIVTSGAVYSDPNTHRSKNLRAGVGQPKLMRHYLDYFDTYDIEICQLLLTDEDLVSGRTQTTENTLLEAFAEGIIPVINGNDPVDDEETKAMEFCADNDKLFMLVCKLIKADIAVIGFGQEGLLDDQNNIVRVVDSSNRDLVSSFAKGGSGFGHGQEGMKTKIEALNELAGLGIRSILAPGKTRIFLIKAVNTVRNKKYNFGTIFLP